MPRFSIVTDDDLSHAGRDPAFRQQIVVKSLQDLIELMNRLRADPDANGPELDAQLREGADLAVKLSDIVKRLAAPAKSR